MYSEVGGVERPGLIVLVGRVDGLFEESPFGVIRFSRAEKMGGVTIPITSKSLITFMRHWEGIKVGKYISLPPDVIGVKAGVTIGLSNSIYYFRFPIQSPLSIIGAWEYERRDDNSTTRGIAILRPNGLSFYKGESATAKVPQRILRQLQSRRNQEWRGYAIETTKKGKFLIDPTGQSFFLPSDVIKDLCISVFKPWGWYEEVSPDKIPGIEVKPKPEGYPKNPVLCPVCRGYGIKSAKIDRYGIGKHFKIGCSQCHAHGWVDSASKDSVCIHSRSEMSNKEYYEKTGRRLFRTQHALRCAHCGDIIVVDSSG